MCLERCGGVRVGVRVRMCGGVRSFCFSITSALVLLDVHKACASFAVVIVSRNKSSKTLKCNLAAVVVYAIYVIVACQ